MWVTKVGWVSCRNNESSTQVLGSSDRHVALCVMLKNEEPYMLTLFCGYADRRDHELYWEISMSFCLPVRKEID